MTIRNLEALARPTSIAVIGASRRGHAVGNVVLRNVLDGGFSGNVYAVNPHRVVVGGTSWIRSVDRLPEAPSLAIVATKATAVPEILRSLGQIGTKVAVVLANGFETATGRASFQDAIGTSGLRVIGPNCLGIALPAARLTAGFGPLSPPAGGLAFLSQSGAIAAEVIDWARAGGVGFSAIISVGDALDVDLADLIDLYAEDRVTHAILLQLEGVTDAQKLLSAIRAAAATKPVVVVKSGKTPGAAHAVMSHTGALVGAYDVYEAALRRAGATLVEDVPHLLAAAQMLTTKRRYAGPRLAIVTNGGGAGIAAVDALQRSSASLAKLSPTTITSLAAALPAGWSRSNPVDVLGDATPDRVATALRACLDDPEVDAVLVVHCPTALFASEAVARATVLAAAGSAKPVFGCWLGPQNAERAQSEFEGCGLPLFGTVEDAISGFDTVVRDAASKALAHAPAARSLRSANDIARARNVVASARQEGRTILTSVEVRAILEAYGVALCDSRFAPNVEAIVAACKPLTPPFALKICSPDFTHKSDVGGVALDLPDVAAVTEAATQMLARIAAEHPSAVIRGFDVQSMTKETHGREIIVGIAHDPTFGPVLMFGAGGTAVEVLHDKAVELPPLDDDLARAMVMRTRIGRLLQAYRGIPAADIDAIVRTLEALSALAIDCPDINELDINPLVASPRGVVALDARISISPQSRLSRMAIRPPPREWEAALPTRAGLLLRVRPVRPDDEPVLHDLFEHVSPEDLRFRFLTGMREVSHERLIAMTRIDYRRAMHFLAFVDGVPVASAFLVGDVDGVKAEVALSVRQGFKGKGISWAMLNHVLAYARSEGITEIVSVESVENRAALSLEEEMGFETVSAEGAERTVRKRLNA